ncbi:antitoxin HicB [Microbacterium aerolatum]|uniref:antitoxin HicB n=1 Tax=Microbacterium aerolatum TaxID=153731 RepID=UPI002000B4C7|nr:antitoxin HicB [Microbacterium aerolatum]MCK3771116.1 antitoxin HicB [Microbacterium aerolatum]
MTNAEHYTYRLRWSAEDRAYIGTVAEMPSLSWAADTQNEAFTGIRSLVTDVLDDMLATGETPRKRSRIAPTRANSWCA